MDLRAEEQRLPRDARTNPEWRHWGPYLSERQWGTVREDYSDDGDAWDYFTHDQARSRAYRWGEDGLAGHLRRQAAAVLRAGAVERRRPDPQGAAVRPDQHRGQPRRGRQGVLLLPRQHAHALLHAAGSTSTRSAAFPYDDLVATNRARGRRTEYELLDTGVFDDDRYFDVVSSTPRPAPRTCSVRITVDQPRARRGDAPRAADAVVPQHLVVAAERPRAADLSRVRGATSAARCSSEHRALGELQPARRAASRRCSSARTKPTTSGCAARRTRRPTSKDGINDYVVSGAPTRSTPRRRHQGRRARPARRAGRRQPSVRCGCALTTEPAAGRRRRPVRRLRRRSSSGGGRGRRLLRVDHAAAVGRRRASVMRQALAGMLWSKQYYYFDVDAWLARARRPPAAPPRRHGPQRGRGSTWSTTTSSRCPTSGSTPGTRRGTSPSTRIAAGAWSTPTSPRASST